MNTLGLEQYWPCYLVGPALTRPVQNPGSGPCSNDYSTIYQKGRSSIRRDQEQTAFVNIWAVLWCRGQIQTPDLDRAGQTASGWWTFTSGVSCCLLRWSDKDQHRISIFWSPGASLEREKYSSLSRNHPFAFKVTFALPSSEMEFEAVSG